MVYDKRSNWALLNECEGGYYCIQTFHSITRELTGWSWINGESAKELIANTYNKFPKFTLPQ